MGGRELFGRRKDGTAFPVEIGLNPVRVDADVLVLASIADISARKHLEHLKDEFVSTVSHELRTPMTSIAGSLGLIAGGAAGKLPATAARLIAIAQANCQRLVRLVNDILDVEQFEADQVSFDLKPVEVRSVVEQVMEAMLGFADAHGVRVRLDARSVPGEVHADPDRLAQVVTNLLSNAIKFSPPNGEVVVAVERGDEKVRVSVRDHGSGIPPVFRPRIFKRFAQAHGAVSRQKGGTGLGLSIVKQIVTRLGGQVGFDDAPGGGTVFYFELPSRDRPVIVERSHDRAAEHARLAAPLRG
jgi:signal transduction histidine kinase